MQSIALPRCAVTCRYMRALHTSGPVLRGLRRRPNADVRQELVLRATVPRLGVAGEVVAVKPGYARNYLVPKGLALFATPLNKGVYARPVHGGTATSKATPTAPTTGLVGESLQQTTHSKMVRYLQNHPLVFKRQKGNSWIITKDIVRKYACDKLRVAIPRERLQMPEEGFTDFGEYRVPVQVAESHPASLLINVVPR